MTLLVAIERQGQRILAADTMAVSADGWGQKYRGVDKIIHLTDGAIAFAGDGAVRFRVEEEIQRLALNGIDVSTDDMLNVIKASVKKRFNWESLMISDKGITSLFDDRTTFTHDKPFDTKGSGLFVALGAIEAMYDSGMSNKELLDKTFAITAKNINTVGKFYNAVYRSITS